MKNFIIFSFFIFMFGCSVDNKLKEFKKLGTEEFSVERWAQANSAGRGTMIYDFLKKNWPITEKNRDFVLSQLGEPTAYAGQEYYPAYAITTTESSGTAKLVFVSFIAEPSSGKITAVYLETN
jgi:hypothetical protein